MIGKIYYIRLGFILLGVVTAGLTACQDRVIFEDNTPFGEGIIRLGDTVVVEIDGTSIYLSDVERAAAARGLIPAGTPLTTDNPVFRQVLDELIDQRLLSLDALRQSVDQEDETRRRLGLARERILGNILIEKHLAQTVTEQTVRRMYDEQAGLRDRGLERRARHVLVKTEDEIKAVKERLEKGEALEDLAFELSIDRASQAQKGDLGFFARDQLAKIFTQQAFSAKIGEVSAPFETEFGWHIMRVEAERQAPQPSFGDIRSEIETFLTQQEIQRLLSRLRQQGDVKLLFGQAIVEESVLAIREGDISNPDTERSPDESEKLDEPRLSTDE